MSDEVDLATFTTSCGYLRCEVCAAGPRCDELADVTEYAGRTLVELTDAARQHWLLHHRFKLQWSQDFFRQGDE